MTEAPSSLVMEIVENSPVSALQGSAARPVASYGGSKYILVDISEQHMYVYEGDVLIQSFVASTGINNGTRTGKFQFRARFNRIQRNVGYLDAKRLGILVGGLENGIHALPILSGATLWAGFGRPVSFGCVVLGTYEAQVLYDWADMDAGGNSMVATGNSLSHNLQFYGFVEGF
jgi:lipoprotein-anchoring transpeptidase ErfK/SrfK